MKRQKIVICACSSRKFITSEQVAHLAASLRVAGYEVTIKEDICELALTEPEAVAQLASEATILGCYTRAMRAIVATSGYTEPETINIRGRKVEDILKKMEIDSAAKQSHKWQAEYESALEQIKGFEVKVATDAWYPVLDGEKCVDCGKCHDFCLFGVYSIEDGKVKVTQPRNCKNNCPACARVCPTGAVIFPKYDRSPVNGGTASEEGVFMLDMDTMYADALRARLEQRRASVTLLKKRENDL